MKRAHAKKAIALAVSLAFAAASAQAATMTVTSTDDDFRPLNCNLRKVLASMGGAFAQPPCVKTGDFGDNDTIVFAPGLVNSTITLERGELVVTGNVTILGSGQIVDANYGSRVMYISDNAFLTASNLTLTHGYGGLAPADAVGAGLYIHGGGANLTNVTISHNVAMGSGAGVNVYASPSSVTFSHSTISDNMAIRRGAAGIAVYASYVDIDDSVVSRNVGNQFGAVALFSVYDGYASTPAGVRLLRTTISANLAGCSQDLCVGGIYGGYETSIKSTDSTISGNTADGNVDRVVGGVYSNALSMINTTVSGNIASGKSNVAGGIWQTNGTATLTNVTVSANRASDYTLGTVGNSGLAIGYGGDVTQMAIVNSIIAGNDLGTAFEGSDLAVSATAAVGLTSSVIGTNVGIASFSPNLNNHINVAPLLGLLQDNGGPTWTMLPLEGSPAIDIGNAAFTPPAYDQRGPGFARVFNGAIDAGAVEFGGDTIFAASFESGP